MRAWLLLAVLAVPAFGVDARAVDPLAAFAPTAADPDPSTRIEGIVVEPPQTSTHIARTERIDYPRSPPFGGPHDAVWADCDGTVYDTAVRNENMVLAAVPDDHGAVGRRQRV